MEANSWAAVLPVPPPRLPSQVQAQFNFCAVGADEHVYGAERPGFVKPSREAQRTPRGPQVNSSIVGAWIKHITASGVRRVLCLLGPAELAFYEEDLLAVYRSHFTAVDHVDPSSSSSWNAAAVLQPLVAAQVANEPICVLCATGQVRTGTVLALWLHHRHLHPLPVALEHVTAYSASQGAIRRPTLESVLELLMANPQQQGPSSLSTAVAAASRALPSQRPPRTKDLHFTIIQTGGTIDKDYPRLLAGYAFEIGDAAAGRILSKVPSAFSYDVVSCCRKDSQDMTDEDRHKILEVIKRAPGPRFIVTHGTDTMLETAMYIKEAEGLGPDKVVVMTGAHKPQKFIDTDADFNLGQAVASAQTLLPGVYVCMSGRVLDASTAKRDRQGLFCSR